MQRQGAGAVPGLRAAGTANLLGCMVVMCDWEKTCMPESGEPPTAAGGRNPLNRGSVEAVQTVGRSPERHPSPD